MSLDRLIAGINRSGNPTVAGLDPKLSYIPKYIVKKAFEKHGETMKGAAKAILEFNKCLIDALHDIVPAVKLQAAYYEMYGYHGMKTLAKTAEYAKANGMYVITDGKRNDIGATSEAYAAAYLGETAITPDSAETAFYSDALTVNGYLGTDGVKPFLKECAARDKGLFILLKTSNPSSGELQDKILENGRTVYGEMAEMCAAWGREIPGKYGYNGVGAVVGATYPEQLAELRGKFPETFFLIPGYGAQGGAAANIALAFDKNGQGGIVNNSRGIMTAYISEDFREKDFQLAARAAAEKMKAELTRAISGKVKTDDVSEKNKTNDN
ncbi:orotidine 5'-phosphate decarboxylase [Clostridia bacterium]|nr:orotidine 5'-phosphate decarboxylase [Clostridia bacterium]